MLAGREHSVELELSAVNRLGRSVRHDVACSPLRSHIGQVTGAIVLLEEHERQDDVSGLYGA